MIFEQDPRNPWDASSDFKRYKDWPEQMDGNADTGLMGNITKAAHSMATQVKSKVQNLIANPQNMMNSIQSAKAIVQDPKKVLVQTTMQQASQLLANQAKAQSLNPGIVKNASPISNIKNFLK